MDLVDVHRDVLARLLPGDPVRALETVAYHPGAEHTDRPITHDRMGEILTGTPDGARQQRIDAQIGGVNLVGVSGSLAVTLRVVLGETSPAFLAVTDRSLAVLAGQLVPESVVWQVDRSRIVRLERAPKGLQRARVGIVFDDSSAICVGVGGLTGAAAQRVAELF